MDKTSVISMDSKSTAVCVASPVIRTLQRWLEQLRGTATSLTSAEGLDAEQTDGTLSIYPPRSQSQPVDSPL